MDDIEYGKDCAFIFKSYSKINKIFPDIENWKIKKVKNYQERIERTIKSKIFNSIKEKAESFVFNQKISDEEIVSWIDSLYLINEIFKNEYLDEEIKKRSSILQEYIIPYTKDNRADIIICKDNKLVIIEFTYEKSKYINKAQQCFVYKEILKQQLNNKIECYSYVFSYTNEETETLSGDYKLEEQINDLVRFLNTNLTDNNALDSLMEITYKNKTKQ